MGVLGTENCVEKGLTVFSSVFVTSFKEKEAIDLSLPELAHKSSLGKTQIFVVVAACKEVMCLASYLKLFHRSGMSNLVCTQCSSLVGSCAQHTDRQIW